MKKTIEEKLSIIKLLKEGASIKRLAKEHHVLLDTILAWARLYDRYGEDGLRPMSHARRNIPKEIKEEILRQYFEESIPLPWLAVSRRISDGTIKKWIKEARENGRWADYERHRRGRPSVDIRKFRLLCSPDDTPIPNPKSPPKGICRHKRGRPPKNMGKKNWKKTLAEMTPLERENLRLRAENELLKKVQALVLEKKMSGNGHKPSTN